MDGMEGDVVHGVHERLVLASRRLVPAMALEREVVAVTRKPWSVSRRCSSYERRATYETSFSSTYLCAHRFSNEGEGRRKTCVLNCDSSFDAADGETVG